MNILLTYHHQYLFHFWLSACHVLINIRMSAALESRDYHLWLLHLYQVSCFNSCFVAAKSCGLHQAYWWPLITGFITLHWNSASTPMDHVTNIIFHLHYLNQKCQAKKRKSLGYVEGKYFGCQMQYQVTMLKMNFYA